MSAAAAPEDWLPRVQQQASELAALQIKQRPEILRQTAGGDSAPDRALELLDAMRWLDRLGYHTWRISNYLGREDQPGPPSAAAGSHPDE